MKCRQRCEIQSDSLMFSRFYFITFVVVVVAKMALKLKKKRKRGTSHCREDSHNSNLKAAQKILFSLFNGKKCYAISPSNGVSIKQKK